MRGYEKLYLKIYPDYAGKVYCLPPSAPPNARSPCPSHLKTLTCLRPRYEVGLGFTAQASNLHLLALPSVPLPNQLIIVAAIGNMEKKIFWLVFVGLSLIADLTLPLLWGVLATFPIIVLSWWIAYRSDWF